MIKCVFTKGKDFKELEKASGLSPASLEFVIYKYQNLNNTDNFPSLEYVKSMADPNIKSNINELENKASNITNALDSFNVNIAYFNNNDRSKEETIKIENSVRSFVAKSLQNFNLNVEYVNDSNDNFKTRLSGDTLFINLSSIHNETDLDSLIQGIKLKYPKKFNKDLDSKITEVTELLETGYPIILQDERNKSNFNKSGPIILKEGDNFDVIHTDELPEAILFKYKGVTYLFYDEAHLNDTIGNYKSLKHAIDNNAEGLSIVTQEGSLGNILNNIPAGTSQLLNTEDVLGNSLSDINLSAINTLLHKMEGKTEEALKREYEGREDLLSALKGLKTALTNEQQLVGDNPVYNQEIGTKKDGDTYFFSPKPFKAKDGSLFKTKEEVALYERKQRKNKTPIPFEQKKQLFRRYLNILESGSIHFTNPTGLANHRILNTVFEDYDPTNTKDRVIDLYSFAVENLPDTDEAVKSYESVLENINERIEESSEGIKVLKKDRTSLNKSINKKQKEVDSFNTTLNNQADINYEVNLGAEEGGEVNNIPEVKLSEPLTEVTDLYGNTLIVNTSMLETSESEVGDIHWVKGTTGDLITVKNPKEIESLNTLEEALTDLNNQLEELNSDIDSNQSDLDKLNNLKKDSETKLNSVPKEFKSSIEDLLINRYVERIHKDLAVKNKYDKDLESTYTGTTGRTFNRKSESHNTTDRKIALMQKMFGVRFEKDYSMTGRGALLNSNHPLTKKYGVPVIVINPDILLSDTVFHEIGHLYIELLGGLNDRMVQQAIRALKTSDFYVEIAEKYPELEGDNLDKEVLATALGLEADRLFDNNLTNLTWWQRFIRTLKDKLHAWFGIKTGKDSDVLLDLAREMLSDTSRIPAGAVYQSSINFYSKYEIPTSKTDKDGKAIPVDKQQEAIKLFEKLRDDIKTDFEDGKHDYMKDGDLVTSTSISTTATRIAKTNQVSKIANNKGDYTIPFERDNYNKDNIHVELARPVISNPLAKALDDFLHGDIDDAPKDFILKENVKNWVDQYIKEVVEMTTSESDEVLNMMFDNAGESVTSFRQAIEDNLESILDRAEEYSKGSKQAPIVGNSIHKAMEDALEVIKNGGIPTLPRNINDKTGGKFLNEFTKIIKRGLSEGSVFFTEQVLWDNNTSRAGTADLIEITKDGEFRVYDFKTTYSFKNKKGTPKNNYQLYVYPGYLHQVLSYSNILENYGLTPAKDAYNIIMLETKYSNVVNEASPFTINDFKIQSLEQAGLGQSFTKASQQVDRHFKPRADLDQINNRSEIETIEDAAVKLKDTILLWKRELNKKMRGTTLAHFDKYYKEVSKLLGSDFVKEHNKFSKSQNIKIISSFIDNVMKQIRVLEDTDVNNPDSEYLMSLNYVLQIGETLHKIKEIVNDRSLLEAEGMSVEGAVKLTEDLNSTIDYINTTRNFYKTKLKEQAINLLAENSNLAEGRIKELLEFEARKKGITDKDARRKYVFDNLARKKAEAKKTEITYWTAQFDNGILDIRSIERFMMDPGAVSSQFVQVVKGMMDGTDMSIRREMLDLAPEVNEFYEQIKQRNPSGGTINQWGRFVNKSKQYIPQLDKEVEMLNGTLIPEFISDFYTDRVEFLRLRDNLMYKKKSILDKYQNKAIPEEAKKELEKVNEKLAGLQKAYNKIVAKQRKNKKYKEARVNPEFSKLSKEDQEALRFMHTKLKASDMFIDDGKLKLTKDLGNDVFIYNLPKQRMSQLEAVTNGKAGGQFISSIRDMVRPPADDTEYNVSEEEFNDSRDSKDNGDITSSRTDLDGNLIFDIPLWYRNNLEDPRLQSYDLPTMIVENHQTSLNYKQGLDIESDLFVILESLNSENDANVVRTDGFVSGKLKDSTGKLFQKSTNNNIYNALKSSIDNRIYKRPYVGTFTKRNYQMIKAVEKVVQYSSINALSLNFKSAFATSGQGAIYRFIEGMVGEHFTTKDWQAGNTKTFADLPNMILDSQKHVPTSKTNLLLKHFGLEQQAEALVNKFVQDNFVTKNLDSNSLYIITSMAETVVTSMLMYSKLNNIKVMNANQEYIDAEGNVVTIDKAMSLDEAYTVSDNGKLELNKNVIYTNHSLLNKYNEKGNDTGIAATEISRYMQGLYADLYGQYNSHLKSEFQRTVIGRMVMSMKGWFPRGVHRRFRNLTTSLTTFEEMREDRNLYKRFYSQDLKQFQEGYYTSLVRYVASTIKGHKIASMGLIGSGKDVWNTMSEHERANLKRSLIELAVMSSLTALSMLLVEIARNMGDDDEDKEKVYAAAYFAWRINDELTTFINPKTLINMIRNPAAAFNTFDSLWKVLTRFIDFSYEDGEFDWLIDERYERGSKEGDLKLYHESLKLVNPLRQIDQAKSILGFESKTSMEDTYKTIQNLDRL